MSRYLPIDTRRQQAAQETQAASYEFYDRRGRWLGREPALPLEESHQAEWEDEEAEADPSHVGHYAGIHPEHRPWMSEQVQRPAARSRQQTTGQGRRQPAAPRHAPTPTPEGRAATSRATRRLPEEPEARQTARLPEARRLRFWLRWLLVGVLLLLVMLTGWLLFTVVGSWWQGVQDGWTYGLPRTFQVDQYVGQQDSPSAPDHFIALNLHGLVEVVQINPQHPEQDHIYTITSVSDVEAPVRLRFADTTGNGKLDLLVSVGDSTPYTVVLRNTGKAFQPQQQPGPPH